MPNNICYRNLSRAIQTLRIMLQVLMLATKRLRHAPWYLLSHHVLKLCNAACSQDGNCSGSLPRPTIILASPVYPEGCPCTCAISYECKRSLRPPWAVLV